MLTGTPLDLTPFGGLLAALGWLYWLLALAIILLALWWPKRWWLKLGVAAMVLSVFIVPVALHAMKRRAEYDVAKAKLDAAMAHFEIRCKSAGEKITRTVENVDGVAWMKWRDKRDVNDDFDQFKLSDPYGRDCGAEDCIKFLLRATKGLEIDPEAKMPFHRGYAYVESTDPRDEGLYRYTMRLKPGHLDHQELEKQQAGSLTARYGITWNDISTREDREHWIAGSSLRVVNLQTNEIIAERVGYMMDRGQGSQAGFRTPWLEAEKAACPAFDRSEAGNPMKYSRSRFFIFKVLQPSREK